MDLSIVRMELEKTSGVGDIKSVFSTIMNNPVYLYTLGTAAALIGGIAIANRVADKKVYRRSDDSGYFNPKIISRIYA